MKIKQSDEFSELNNHIQVNDDRQYPVGHLNV